MRSLRFPPASFALLLAPVAFGQGDLCSSAVAVTPGTYVADGPSSGAGHDDICFGTGLGINADWYVFTPAANGTIDVWSCDGGADTRLSVHGGACGSLTCLGSNDDFCEMGPGMSFFASEVDGVPVTTGQNYYIQWDDRWVTTGFTWNLVYHCANAPSATYVVVPDCANGVFYIEVTITGMGSANTVDITNNGGAPPVTGVALGTYTIGPFPVGTDVQYVLVNNTDPGCDLYSASITNFPCPVVSCGPDTYTYCYTNGENTYLVYQGTSTFSLALQFTTGPIYAFGGDYITVYDGLDASAPVLYTGFNGGDLAGLMFISTNPDHALTLQIVSDGFASCGDGYVTGDWQYIVGCLDCTAPVATYSIVLDCVNFQFYVEVDLTDLGTDPSVDITNDAGAPALIASTPGTYSVGPFPSGTVVTVSVVNDANPLCTVNSGPLTNFPCPIISCGIDQYTYCYANNEDHYFIYQGTGTDPIALLFDAGAIYQFGGDLIYVYDGLDGTAPLMYSGTNGGDLTGLMFISTNPDHALSLRIVSDAFTSCGDFGVFPPWDYRVGCYDCSPPIATYDVVLDCINSQFSIEVDLTSLGSDPDLEITNDAGAPTVIATSPGVYQSGPFPNGTIVTVTLVNDANALCNTGSIALTNSPCPVISCGPDNYQRCYPTNWDSTVVYQSANTYPIALLFNAGTIEACCDNITVYDGPDVFSPQIYFGNNGGDLTGLFFVSTNPDNALTIHFHSDFSVDCQTSFGFIPLNWTVSCLDCTNPAVTFGNAVTDCIHLSYWVEIDVTSTGSATVVDVVNSLNTDTVQDLTVGTHLVGPFPLDSTVTLSVLNGDNPLCRVNGPSFFAPSDSCTIVSCGFDNYNYCYTNDDDAWFVYQAAGPYPITIGFFQGQLLVNDKIVVYNGLNDFSAVLFNGNNGGDLTGFAMNSDNADNALTLRVVSDPAGSCMTGEATAEMQWYVACGLVGMDEMLPGSFLVYPNPTNGSLTIQLAEAATGDVQVQLFDITGRLVLEQQLVLAGRTGQLDLSGLQTGNYTIRLITGEWLKTQRVQVAR